MTEEPLPHDAHVCGAPTEDKPPKTANKVLLEEYATAVIDVYRSVRYERGKITGDDLALKRAARLKKRVLRAMGDE